jgi:hypothetical protein
MESEEILGPQFSDYWSTCSPIPEKRFPISWWKTPFIHDSTDTYRGKGIFYSRDYTTVAA